MKRKLISFDWAMKKLLRSKANFDILEGFLSELLHDDITIIEILESESNKETQINKFNRVDLKVKTKTDEIVIIEVQYDREYDYFHRLAYGTSKVISEHLKEGEAYSEIVKVISVNIVYFELGEGLDYVYHGTTNFNGIHEHDVLSLSSTQKSLYKREHIQDIYPEYYLIKVNNFDDVAKDTLDEWIYFLKNEEIKDNFNAKGLKKAKQELDVMHLSEPDRADYEAHQDSLHHEASIVKSNYEAGKLNGMEKGEEKGKQENKIETARLAKNEGASIDFIAKITGLSKSEIEAL